MRKFTQSFGLKTFLFGFLSVLFVAFLVVSSYGQSLTTDLTDYSPGSTVILTGSGFGANETVTMQVKHFPDCCNNSTSPDHQPWYVTADGNGDFTTFWFVDDDESGATLKATADGQTTAYHAEAFFTDAVATITLYSLATRTTASESDAFAWGSTVYVKLTGAIDNRCYKIVWTNGATTLTSSSPSIAPNGTGTSPRNIDFTIPSTGPSGIWTAALYQGINPEALAGNCIANAFPGGYTLMTTLNFDVAQLLFIGATDDASVNENNQNNNNGTGSGMNVESRSGGNNQRTYVKFNTSSIPNPSTVINAKIRLFMRTAPGVSRNYDAYSVSADWVETTITWLNKPGVAATASDQQFTGTTNNTLVRWSVTADVNSIVNGVTRGPSYGWRISDHSESESTTSYTSTFQTSEDGSHLAIHAPILMVDYNPCVAPTSATTGSDSPICEGSVLHLTSSVTGGYPVPTPSWTGTGTFSPSNSDANPSVTGAATGTYTVTYTNTCGTATYSVSIIVNTPPSSATAGSNSPICEGSDLNLTSSANGTPTPTYAWTGPNGFTSTDQNPTIPVAIAADATGTYYVTATNACGSTTANVAVTVIPTPTAGFAPTTFSGLFATIHFSGTPNVEITYNKDGGASSTITLDGSGNASLYDPVPVSTTDQVYNLISARYTSGPECIHTFTDVHLTLGLHTINLYSIKDSYLRDGADNTNEGANPLLRISNSGNNRTIVGFDLSGVSLTNLSSARLIMNISDNSDNWGGGAPGTRYVDVCRILVPWTEGNGWNEQGNIRGTGIGVTWNCANDANINNQSQNGPSWNGGTFAASTAEGVLHYNGLLGEVSWDVTQDVFDGAQNGWLIKKRNEGQNGRVYYKSRENTNPPRLELTYIVVSPGKPLAIVTEEAGQSLEQISIFPNPAKESFTLQINNSINQISILTLNDLRGKEILHTILQLQEGVNKYPVSIAGISPGLYIVRLKTGTVLRQARLLINR